jgi:hypothetical protein
MKISPFWHHAAKTSANTVNSLYFMSKLMASAVRFLSRSPYQQLSLPLKDFPLFWH